MDILRALILGLVQGLTEFLPVSSSGHLLIAGRILGEAPSIAFELCCHLGTLFAVIIVMRREVFEVVRHPLSKPMRLIALSAVPTVIIVLCFESFFRDSFSGALLPYAFMVTAILLVASSVPRKKQMLRPVGYLDAAVMGAAQGLAALPGLSRSGTTLAAGLFCGVDKDRAVRFSFLMSIPVIIGSSGYEFFKNGLGSAGIAEMLTGFAASLISGILAVKLMLKIVKKGSLDGFAVYLALLAVFMFLNDGFFQLF